jgi:glucokinase
MIGVIDIGGTKTALGLVDEAGNILQHETYPTEPERGPESLTLRVANGLRNMAANEGCNLIGIGVGCTGPVYPQFGTIGKLDFLPGWEGYQLVGELMNMFDLPVALENDADATALGEWAWGSGKGKNRFIMVTVGTGIGAGLIINGEIYRGVDESHPEIGHHFIDPSGPPCSCGGNGCWESLASGPAMEKWAQEYHPQHIFRNAKEIFTSSILGDIYASKAVEHEAFYLGLGLVNLITIFAPEVIALSGGVMNYSHLLMPSIHKQILQKCGYVPSKRITVMPVPDNQTAGLRGAAKVWMNKYLCDN